MYTGVGGFITEQSVAVVLGVGVGISMDDPVTAFMMGGGAGMLADGVQNVAIRGVGGYDWGRMGYQFMVCGAVAWGVNVFTRLGR